ncbi:hypothetical protein SDRG_15730 [Saprolegnia diclina VS20]|uniref:HTH myb-type domain-containing protein n=1 Tax=Saprolegnia diclina (strain VS20) TaxID=1156394 RepID=T0PM60_SAPDV|nr:hypothetical protein SDRG_15730 [Saprolegnia diclina VS20]EQC26449.1 hypothetical protein SDRG_15730 [Saprolegnia diclina VS20]|eukprot:XP_008620134.1 hypothetical protein SDRG_15730 [Saprolegnia diclina VS20]
MTSQQSMVPKVELHRQGSSLDTTPSDVDDPMTDDVKPRKAVGRPSKKPVIAHGLWSLEEHERFLVGIQLYPEGPWKAVADIIQTRNAKQAQTHMQKCKEKILRHRRRRDEVLRGVILDDQHAENDVIRLAAAAATANPVLLRRSKHADNLRFASVEPIPLDSPAAAVLSSTQPLDGHKITWTEALDYFWTFVSAADDTEERFFA